MKYKMKSLTPSKTEDQYHHGVLLIGSLIKLSVVFFIIYAIMVYANI